MRGNFGLFRTFSPKLPRIHVDYIVMQMRKINREKGYYTCTYRGVRACYVKCYTKTTISYVNYRCPYAPLIRQLSRCL